MREVMALRLAVVGALLLVAGAWDWRKRAAPNALWVLGGVAAAAGIVWVVAASGSVNGVGYRSAAVFAYVGAAFAAGLAWLAWRGGWYGGADAKALMVVAWLLPWPVWVAGYPVPFVLLLWIEAALLCSVARFVAATRARPPFLVALVAAFFLLVPGLVLLRRL